MKCPNCGEELEQETVDIGVGSAPCGPPTCPNCYWFPGIDPFALHSQNCAICHPHLGHLPIGLCPDGLRLFKELELTDLGDSIEPIPVDDFPTGKER
jgi:hypothetical protein